MSLYVGDRQVCRFGCSIQTCTLDGHLRTVTYTRCHINTIDSPDDEHSARNMYRIGINIYEKTNVHQVGYLQELNRDARSTEHKKLPQISHKPLHLLQYGRSPSLSRAFYNPSTCERSFNQNVLS